jgi:hypothetical protein
MLSVNPDHFNLRLSLTPWNALRGLYSVACSDSTSATALLCKMGKILIFKSFLFSGYQPEMTDLLTLTEVIGTTAYKEFDYNILEGHTIYTTISCENNAGLFSILSSNGVRISEHSPSIDSAVAEVLSEQATEYNRQGHINSGTKQEMH